MNISFTKNGWEDYQYWAETDRKTLRKINKLISEISRTPFTGLGKPEALKFDFAGYWSRRITLEHRLVYKVESEQIVIIACRFHYD